MRWQKKTVRAMNATRGTLVGERIRVAESGLTRAVGLLGERELQPGDGLIIVPSQGVHTVGMRFPIDVVILDGEWKVIAVRHNLLPYRMTRLFWNAAAVLELQSGIAKLSGTVVGDKFEFTSVDGAVQSQYAA